jgi:hypothetical protein
MQVNGSPVDLLSPIPPDVRWIATGLIAVAALVFGWWQLRRGARALIRVIKRNSFEDNLTVVAAVIATGVSATGMWKFAGDVLHLWWPLRIVLFAFIEIAIITSAVRAKRSMRENFKAGVDGIAVWVLACLTAVLSSLDAASFGEAVFRLSAPLVTAWLWERGMRLERHRLRGTSSIHWRVTPERIFVRLGLAEASDRTAGEVDTQRRLTRVALAAKRAKVLRDNGAPQRKVRSALAKLDKVMDEALAHTGLDVKMQERVRDQVAALYSTDKLMDVPADSAWVQPVEEPFTRLANETQRLNSILAAQHDAKSTIANLAMLAADATGHRLISSTIPFTPAGVNDKADERADETVDERANGVLIPSPRRPSPSATPSTPSSASVMTVERVDELPDFDIRDSSVYDLERLWSSTISSAPPSTRSEVDEQADDDAGKASKTKVMRAFWDSELAQKRYPPPIDLANHAGASRSLAAELRAQWVEELSGWPKRRAKAALRGKASA